MSKPAITADDQDSHRNVVAETSQSVAVSVHDSEARLLNGQDITSRLKTSFDDSADDSRESIRTLAQQWTQGPATPGTHADAIESSEGMSEKTEKPVAWTALPHKDQLGILTLARLAEPVVQTSLGAYMFFMLKSFDPDLSDSAVSSQAGILAGSFTFAQCLTAIVWGRLADCEWMGRKNVLIIGQAGTLISCVGFGFSRSFFSAVCFRALGGALNGNVGVMRTMISELVVEKKFLPKAFLVMPITFNVGVLVGPLLGGWLQDPVNTFPKTFGPGSALGGHEGVAWMRTYPYAFPNLISAVFLLCSLLLLFFGLRETHIDRRHRSDPGIQFRNTVLRLLKRLTGRKPAYEYSRLNDHGVDDLELTLGSRTTHEVTAASNTAKRRPQLAYRRMFTRNVLLTFLTHGLFAMHLGSFHNLWFLFLSTPRANSKDGHERQLPFVFGGGLGLPPPTIGFAIGILGALGLCLQFGVYSRLTHRFGIIGTYRRSLPLFPIMYTLVPFLAVLPTKSEPPHAADGPWVWMGISGLLFLIVAGRTFSLPIAQILINNCTPHPSVLSSIHGWGTSVSALARTIGPVIWSSVYGLGLRHGIVGLAWWTLAVEALIATVAAQFLYEGTGHEIRLEGDP